MEFLVHMHPVYAEMERITLKCCVSALNFGLLLKKTATYPEPKDIMSDELKIESEDMVNLTKGPEISALGERWKDLVEFDEIIERMYGKNIESLRLYQMYAAVLLSVRTFITPEFYRELVAVLYAIYSYESTNQSVRSSVWDKSAWDIMNSCVQNFFHQEDHIAANLFKETLAVVHGEFKRKKELLMGWPDNCFEDVVLIIKGLFDIVKECKLAFHKEMNNVPTPIQECRRAYFVYEVLCQPFLLWLRLKVSIDVFIYIYRYIYLFWFATYDFMYNTIMSSILLWFVFSKMNC
eukprot:TRINITY_DN2076_c0_g1_i1.p1 TRINITY_DN2076_c0_g1~~TRINITY_DN2076_c0_g1_i1.p1  ORF type:complete len:293 (+),score=39.66 TRINITY_DN2076_c0_g1_i1:414-1292(+)